MEGKDRLTVCQERLVAAGAVDVKFCFGKVSEEKLSEATEKAASVLEAVLNNESLPMSRIFDRKKAEA